MRLRNKKTGEIMDLSEGFIKDTYNGEFIQIKPVAISNKEGYLYGSLAELNEEWEDYKPAEPIKDDKMRQCLNLWTDINGFKGELTYGEGEDWCSFYEEEKEEELVFSRRICPNLKKGEAYSIAELCGEEEE